MADLSRSVFLLFTRFCYHLIRFWMFRQDPQQAHERMLAMLQRADSSFVLRKVARVLNHLSFGRQPIKVGGVELPYPVILAAGFVKGYGFDNEAQASQAATMMDIIPGWRVMPLLVGPVEFGSFTPHPRVGNLGKVVWRDVTMKSTQNRIGLRNPGSLAAAEFLAKSRDALPAVFGINIAPSPGVEDIDQLCGEVVDSFSVFLRCGVVPSWFTLNISCPNTEDDPNNTQTERLTRALCDGVIAVLNDYTKSPGTTIPLWVKISPDLSNDQYRTLVRVFHETGVRAIIATNTLGMPTPDNPDLIAGVGGGQLYPHTSRIVRLLTDEIGRHQYDLDVIACGGVMTKKQFQELKTAGAVAIQYWSAIVYNGPLAGAYLLQ